MTINILSIPFDLRKKNKISSVQTSLSYSIEEIALLQARNALNIIPHIHVDFFNYSSTHEECNDIFLHSHKKVVFMKMKYFSSDRLCYLDTLYWDVLKDKKYCRQSVDFIL